MRVKLKVDGAGQSPMYELGSSIQAAKAADGHTGVT